jgi:hypothetical protein
MDDRPLPAHRDPAPPSTVPTAGAAIAQALLARRSVRGIRPDPVSRVGVFHRVVRRHPPIPNTGVLLCGLALDVLGANALENALTAEREPVGAFTVFVGGQRANRWRRANVPPGSLARPSDRFRSCSNLHVADDCRKPQFNRHVPVHGSATRYLHHVADCANKCALEDQSVARSDIASKSTIIHPGEEYDRVDHSARQSAIVRQRARGLCQRLHDQHLWHHASSD